MKITWSEAWQIAGEIVDELGIELSRKQGERDKFELLVNSIFKRTGTNWSDHFQGWVRDNPDRLALDSEELHYVVSKLNSWYVPDEIEGTKLRPVDRMVHLWHLMRKQIEGAQNEVDTLRQELASARGHEERLDGENAYLQGQVAALNKQLATTRQHLSEAKEAVEVVNERLRTATQCKCQMVEVKQGLWEIWRTIDCPVHPHTLPGEIYQLGH